MLTGANIPSSPDWWLLRLGARLERDRVRYQRLDDYWRGNPPLPFGNRKMREAYRRFQRQARTNFMKLIAESVCERLAVVGFRAGGAGSDGSDSQAWGWWQANRLDSVSGQVHRAAVVMSRSYVIVGEGSKPGTPLVTGEDPRQVIHESDPADCYSRLAALKTWWDDVAGVARAVLYLPESVHYYRTRSDRPASRDSATWAASGDRWAAQNWELDVSDDYPDGAASNPLGEVPVIPFLNCPDLSGDTLGEFEDVTAVQDRVNTEVLDRMVISAMQAYRQRYATGVDLTDENGNPTGDFDPGADLLWSVPDDKAKFGEFSPADLTGVLKAVSADVEHLAAITRTPPSYMIGSMVNASGDALAAAEVGLVSKVGERAAEFGESWEMVYRLAGKVAGRHIPDDAEVIWRDPQFRTLTEMAAASVQLLTAGVPWRTRMRMLGFSPAEIDRMQSERTAEQMMAAAFAPPAEQDTQQRRLPGAPGGAAAPASSSARSANPPPVLPGAGADR